MPPADQTTPAVQVVPAALHVAAVIIAIEVVIEIVFVIRSSVYGPGGIGLLVIVVGAKFFLALGARRLQAGSALGLLLFESVGLLVAGVSDWAVWLRGTLAVTVVVVFALVASSFHAFPTPELPND